MGPGRCCIGPRVYPEALRSLRSRSTSRLRSGSDAGRSDDVPKFVGIGRQVVELALAGGPRDEHGVARAHAAPRGDRGIAGPRHRDGPVGGHTRQQRDPVLRDRGDPGGVGDGRRDVEVGHERARRGAAQTRRPAHGERHGDRGLVGDPLAEPSSLAEVDPVVGKEQDHGAVPSATRLDRLGERLELLVHRQERGRRIQPRATQTCHGRIVEGWELPEPGGAETHGLVDDLTGGHVVERALVPWRGPPRLVGGRRRERQEPRPVGRRRPHERERLAPEDVGHVVPRTAREPSPMPLVHDRVVVVRGRQGLVRLREPAVPAWRHVRPAIPRVLVQVLADQPRLVPRVVQSGGDRGGLVQAPPRVVVDDARVTRREAGQDRGARRAAHRRGHDGVRIGDPPGRGVGELRLEPRHRGRLHAPRRGGLIVGHDEQHVDGERTDGLGLRRRDDRQREDGDGEGRGEHRARRRHAHRALRTSQMCSPGYSRAHSTGA